LRRVSNDASFGNSQFENLFGSARERFNVFTSNFLPLAAFGGAPYRLDELRTMKCMVKAAKY
jgi:hypothetical protein